MQASANSTAVVCTVQLSIGDAMGVGYSLRALMREQHIPALAAIAYERVAAQLIAAAKLAMVGAR